MGAKPRMGRIFFAEEMQDKSISVVLSDTFWRTKFNADPQILGKTFLTEGTVATIVGVMPPGFNAIGGQRLDLWQPINAQSARYSDRGDHWLIGVARLKPDVSIQQAQVEMNVIAQGLASAYPKTNAGVGEKLQFLHEVLSFRGDYLYPLVWSSLLHSVDRLPQCRESTPVAHRKPPSRIRTSTRARCKARPSDAAGADRKRRARRSWMHRRIRSHVRWHFSLPRDVRQHDPDRAAARGLARPHVRRDHFGVHCICIWTGSRMAGIADRSQRRSSRRRARQRWKVARVWCAKVSRSPKSPSPWCSSSAQGS